MRVNGINSNVRYNSFNFRGEAQEKAVTMPLIIGQNNESEDVLEIKNNNNNIKYEEKVSAYDDEDDDDEDFDIAKEPLSDYGKELFKRFQNFNAESITDLNTCVDVTAESINEDGLTPKNGAFMKIAKTPFFLIIQRISKDEEEEKNLKDTLHSSITKDFKHPSNPIEEAFNQYMEVVPYINQENSASFVMPMFDDLKKLDNEGITPNDILDVVKSHVKRQKEEQRKYEPSFMNQVWSFFFG